jgi:peptidoglycan/LPS O-acetylase OafA/YrhL
MVFFSHAWPGGGSVTLARMGIPLALVSGVIEAGAFGVFVFFMLSSYLITELLMREKEKTGTIHVKAYYARRILRIWPLYFLFIACCFLIRPLTPNYSMSAGQLISMLLLSGNWYFGIHGWGGSFTSHLWSISVEEQFYLIWPVFLKLANRTILCVGFSALMATSFLSLAFLGLRESSANPSIFTNSFVLCSFFALGAIAALWMHGKVLTLNYPIRGFLLVVGITLFTIATMALKIHDSGAVATKDLLLGYALTDIGCMAIFLSFLGAKLPQHTGFLIYLGKISYGLYVYHLACLALTRWLENDVFHKEHWPLSFPLTAVLTFVCASLSYRYIEKPFLRWKEKFEIVQSRRI